MVLKLPAGLSPEASAYCAQFQNKKDLTHNLLKNEKFLEEYLRLDITNNGMEKSFILKKITVLRLAANDTQQIHIINKTCLQVFEELGHASANHFFNNIPKEIISSYIKHLISSIEGDPAYLTDVSSVVDKMNHCPEAITPNHLIRLIDLSLSTRNPKVIDLTDRMLHGYIYRKTCFIRIFTQHGHFPGPAKYLTFAIENNKISFSLYLNFDVLSPMQEALIFLEQCNIVNYALKLVIFNLPIPLKVISSKIGHRITSLEVNRFFDKDFESLGILLNLKSLTLKDAYIRNTNFLKNFPQLEFLQLLKTCILLDSIHIDSLQKLHTLEISDYSSNQITLGTLPSLQKLSFENVNFKSLVIGSLPQCNNATFSLCRLGPNLKFLIPLQESLETLDLSSNTLVYAPKVLSSMTSLKNLNLKGCSLGNTETPITEAINSILPFSLQLPSPSFLDSILRLTQLQNLDLSDNYLREIPSEIRNLTSLITLNILDNRLREIPSALGSLTALEELDLSANRSLSSLPREIFNLNQIREINLLNTNVQNIPEEFDHFASRIKLKNNVPNNDFMIGENAGKKFDINVVRKTISTKVEELIENLNTGFTLEHSNLFVKFIGEAGIDQGGPSKEFFTLLFEQIKNKYTVEGEPYWEKAPKGKREKIFRGIGTLLAIILRTQGRYPIGDIFSKQLYENLVNLPLALLGISFRAVNTEQAFSLISEEQMKTYELLSLQGFFQAQDCDAAVEFIPIVSKLFEKTEYIPSEMQKKYLQGIKKEDIEGEEYHILYDEDFLNRLQKVVKKQSTKLCKSVLRPIFEIFQGFYSFKPMLEARKQLSAEAMYRIIQGNSSREALLSAIEYIETSEVHQEILKNWLETTPQDKLINFVSFVTGSRALKAGQKIKIYFPIEGDGIKAHTCFDGLDIPQNLTKPILIDALDSIMPSEVYSIA